MSLVYVVEDDEDINELLVFNLRKEGFDVKSFLSSIPALKSLEKEKPDIILLDIMLPDMDGLEFCKKLKSDERFSEIPIIMLTAKSTEIDKIVGLELGADDYITKPFSLREVVARIRAILRRTGCKDKEKRSYIKVKGIEIFPEKFEVKIEGKEIPLTSKEFRLLMLLINNKGKVLSREQILSQIWKDELDVYDRTIDVHIKKLRDKLSPYSDIIETVRGVGYRLKED